MAALWTCLASLAWASTAVAFQASPRHARRGPSALASSAASAAPAVGSWQAYQARIKSCVVAIGDRLDASVAAGAPVADFNVAASAFAPINLDALQRELDSGGGSGGLASGGSDGSLASALAAQLERWHFAVVRLNASDAAAVAGLWAHAARFYALPPADRLDLAGPVRGDAAEDASLVVGYCAMQDNAFLETRLAPRHEFRPRFERRTGRGAADGPGLDPSPQALLAGRHVLTRAGLAGVRAAERASAAASATSSSGGHLLSGEAAAAAASGGWARLVDDGRAVPAGSLTASVHRICCYSSGAEDEEEAAAAEGAAAAAARPAVAFGAHTDATFFTVVPVAEVPGLQVFAPGAGWVSPEEHGAHGTDVVLLTGEFVEVLSGGALPCAVHRVLKPRPGRRSRLSAPLLLRGRENEPLLPSPPAGAGGLLGGGLLGGGLLAASKSPQSPSGLSAFPPGVTVTEMHRLLLTLFSEDTRRREAKNRASAGLGD